jgi:hypothetical protein
MKTFTAALAIAALALTGSAVQAKQTTAEKGEARLAKMLEGRVAGEPRNCITSFQSRNVQVIDETAVVYDAGKTVWVARPRNPKMLDRFDVLVMERHGPQICANDMMRTIDPTSGFTTGVVFLDDFVPYTRSENSAG